MKFYTIYIPDIELAIFFLVYAIYLYLVLAFNTDNTTIKTYKYMQTLTKQEVRDLAEENNCESRYEGEIQTMFIIGMNAQKVIQLIIEKGNTLFIVKGEMKRIPQNS